VQILTGRRFAVHALAFSHCGRWLAAGGRGGVHLWDTTAPAEKPQALPVGEYGLIALAFRADGSLVWFDTHRVVRVRNLETKRLTEYADWSEVNPILSPNGTRTVGTFSVRATSVWEVSATAPPKELCAVPGRAPDAAGFSNDGELLAMMYRTSAGRVMRVCNTDTGEVLSELHGPTDIPQQLAFSARNDYLLARWSASLVCWNLAEPGAKPTRTFNPSRKHFVAMAVHPEGRALTLDNERMVRVWDVPSLAAVRTIEWDIGKLYAVAVSPDGARAAVGSHTGRVLIWDWD
jgi:WD40 repeat protein